MYELVTALGDTGPFSFLDKPVTCGNDVKLSPDYLSN